MSSDPLGRRASGHRSAMAAAGLALMGTLGCSVAVHEATLLHPVTNPPPGQVARLRVAVVLQPRDIPPRFQTETDGHGFVFNNVRQFYELGYRAAFANTGVEPTFFAGPPDVPHDAYVYAEADLEASGSLFSHSCTAQSATTVQDAAGKIVFAKAVKNVQDFGIIGAGTDACATAIKLALSEAAAAAAVALKGVK